MKTLKFIDMTLRQASIQRGKELTFKEKLEIARSLDRLRADTIELPPVSGSRADLLANQTIASMVATRISAAVDISSDRVEETWNSIRTAAKPKLNLLCPVSTVQMEYSAHKKAAAMLNLIEEQVKKGRFYSEHVEFSALDATRAESSFLFKALNTAIEAGADKITVCDSAGIMLPDEFAGFIGEIFKNVPGLADIELYVEISNAISMALACAAAAVAKGAAGVKCTVLDYGYPTMEELAAFVQARGVDLDVSTQVRLTDLHRSVLQLSRILEPQKEEESRFSNVALADTSGICLESGDSIREVSQVVQQLGYDLTEEDLSRVYEAFQQVASKKQFVGTKELDAIVASAAMQVPTTYKIKNYVINSGSVISATANILLEKDGNAMRGLGVGDGPIDASFQAIEQVIGHHYELDDFQIQTVTEGRDAMGSALVKLRSGGRVYSGTGISTDIIGASIRAYLSALNKIVYEEA